MLGVFNHYHYLSVTDALFILFIQNITVIKTDLVFTL